MLDVFKALLPRGKAWDIVIDKSLRRFFEGLSGFAGTIQTDTQKIWSELDPATTEELDKWELQFGLRSAALLTEAQRRTRIDSAWKRRGGQDPAYLQETLQAAGFPVYIHEWWVPGVLHPLGGSVNGDEPSVARNPFDYIWDGISEREYIGVGHDDAYVGGDTTFANSQDGLPGYFLVNKIQEPVVSGIGVGHSLGVVGGISASVGAFTVSYVFKNYQFPADPTKYPYVLYVGGETFPNVVTISSSRRNEFEELCLKICPLEQWLGILVQYV